MKEHIQSYFVHVPSHYYDLISDGPKIIEFNSRHEGRADFIHAFYTDEAELRNEVLNLKSVLNYSGCLWISWPKGGSDIRTDLNREKVRAALSETGLVDTKVCSVDENWSALKFMHRLKDRP